MVGESYLWPPLPKKVKNWKLALAVAALMLHASPQHVLLQDDKGQLGSYSFEDYYDGTEGLEGHELHGKLYDIVRNHTVVSYYSAWDHLRHVDEDPANSDNVIYMQRSQSEDDTCGDGNECTSESWNREHVWPKSHGDFGTTMSKVAGTDLHALRPVDNTVNSARSDKDFGEAEEDHSECTECDSSAQAWEPADGTKGDAARTVFYMDMRYNGFGEEPSLTLVNDWTEPSEDDGFLGRICTLYAWHHQDPVSDYEVERNNRVYEIQGNRNPFVDNEGFVEGIWGGVCDEWGNGAIEYTDDISEVEIGPSDRTAMLTMPGGHDYSRPLPLVVSLHGFSGNGWLNSYWMELFESTYENEHLLLWPNGTANSAGARFWNATDACCDFDDTGVDDVGHLMSLLDEVEESFPVDPDRVSFAGHSNGGYMSYRVACDAGARVASIAGLAGATWLDEQQCGDGPPVHVLPTHGTLDDSVPYEGSQWAPGAQESAARWASRAGCDGPATERPARDYDLDLEGAETSVVDFPECERSVEVWSIEGAGHVPAINAAYRADMIQWLLDHRRP